MKTTLLSLVAILSIVTMNVSYADYSYTLYVQNNTNVALHAIDKNKLLSTIAVKKAVNLRITDNGKSFDIQYKGGRVCGSLSGYSAFDFTQALKYGAKRFKVTIIGSIKPGHYKVDCKTST